MGGLDFKRITTILDQIYAQLVLTDLQGGSGRWSRATAALVTKETYNPVKSKVPTFKILDICQEAPLLLPRRQKNKIAHNSHIVASVNLI